MVDNAALHRTLHDCMRSQPWINESYIGVSAHDGVVELWGFVDTEEQRSAPLSRTPKGLAGLKTS